MSSGHYSFQMWYRNCDPSMYRSKNDNVAIRKPKGAALCAYAGHPRRLVSCVTIKGSTNAANKQRYACCRPEDHAHAGHQGVKEKLSTKNARTATAYRRPSQQKSSDRLVVQDGRTCCNFLVQINFAPTQRISAGQT
ncbi:hypothetical protein IG631_00929 [Alternaria alternata]|nr:hypothetical protein IG631_00929 [Alternaria alternata]